MEVYFRALLQDRSCFHYLCSGPEINTKLHKERYILSGINNMFMHADEAISNVALHTYSVITRGITSVIH